MAVLEGRDADAVRGSQQAVRHLPVLPLLGVLAVEENHRSLRRLRANRRALALDARQRLAAPFPRSHDLAVLDDRLDLLLLALEGHRAVVPARTGDLDPPLVGRPAESRQSLLEEVGVEFAAPQRHHLHAQRRTLRVLAVLALDREVGILLLGHLRIGPGPVLVGGVKGSVDRSRDPGQGQDGCQSFHGVSRETAIQGLEVSAGEALFFRSPLSRRILAPRRQHGTGR